MVPEGEPLLEIKLREIGKPKYRCGKYACAGEAIPTELPTRPAPVALTSFHPLRTLANQAALPLDYKQRQTQEAE